MKKGFFLILMTFTLTQCSKEKLDVSAVYMTDALGNPIGSVLNDNQWKNLTYTNSELALFQDLDTADLTRTQLATINSSSYGYPNPFANQIMISTLTQPLNGEIILKYVIADQNMKSVQKGSSRIYVTSSINFALLGNFKAGNYRLYYTYSCEGHEHFFKTWGNIKKL